jgi:two-component system nitrate/nitrite sensor histidine kinase NarX
MSTDSPQSIEHAQPGSLFMKIGLLGAFILSMGFTAMVSALLIAQQTDGLASAVNHSGTLRMQTYRIGMALLQGGQRSNNSPSPRELAHAMSDKLESATLTDVVPESAIDPMGAAYERIMHRWVDELLPAVTDASIGTYVESVDEFVDEIHQLVSLIERRAERYNQRLVVIQVVTLTLTIIVVALALVLLRRRVLRPLQELLRLSERASSGDFSTRTEFEGSDELGQLGRTMNLMSASLSELYGQLESRVSIKTKELERSNQSLSLLYRCSKSLDGSDLTVKKMLDVLVDLKTSLALSSVQLCLHDGLGNISRQPDAESQRVSLAADALDAPHLAAEQEGVELYLTAAPDTSPCCSSSAPVPSAVSQDDESAGPSMYTIVIADQETRYGTFCFAMDNDEASGWQRPVLESWAKQLALALNLRHKIQQGHRLAVHEERSILARELHDSLAQSLSYLKIQAMRLEQLLTTGTDNPQKASGPVDPSGSARAVVAELRAGINSAYQHLRELLTSFRLKVNEQGMQAELQATVDEFRARSHLETEFAYRLPQGIMTPDQEVHVLQIVREALANVMRHSRASHVTVRVSQPTPGWVSVEVGDDGVGMSDVSQPWAHHGLTIMRERAKSLGCKLEILTNQPTGTLIRLCFAVRSGVVDMY